MVGKQRSYNCANHARPYAFNDSIKIYFQQVKSITVKLAGPIIDRYISQGVAKVQLNDQGVWGNICSENWSYQDARVLCGQLGFPDARRNRNTEEIGTSVKGPYLMSDVRCEGTESSLVSCNHSGFGRRTHECSSGKPVVVTCLRRDNNRVGNHDVLKLSFYCFLI